MNTVMSSVACKIEATVILTETAQQICSNLSLGLKEEDFEPPFGYSTKLVAPEVNTEASNFMEQNIAEIKSSILRMGVSPDKVNDLFSDVYVSIVEGELQGNGYDGGESGTDVRQFVFGRLKRYSLNKRYDAKYVEYKSGCSVVAATPTESDDEDHLTGFQAAYKNAASADDIEAVETGLSAKDAIETCMDFCHGTSICIENVFRNLESIDEYISKGKNHCSSSIFMELQEINKEHPEFLEAMTTALQFRAQHREEFLEILDSIA